MVSLSLKFEIKEGFGGDKIVEAFNTYGIYAEKRISITQLNRLTNEYENIFFGNINFKPDSFSIERNFVVCGIIESSTYIDFMANDEVVHDMSKTVCIDNATVVDALVPIEITYPGVPITRKVKYTCELNKVTTNETILINEYTDTIGGLSPTGREVNFFTILGGVFTTENYQSGQFNIKSNGNCDLRYLCYGTATGIRFVVKGGYKLNGVKQQKIEKTYLSGTEDIDGTEAGKTTLKNDVLDISFSVLLQLLPYR